MQTKKQIQQLLTSAGVSPNKRLSQHFLIDLNLIRLLVDSVNIQNTDVVLEAGCGTGSLTEALSRRAGKVIAVETDSALARIAQKQLESSKNVRIIHSDVLEKKHKINQQVLQAIKSSVKKHVGRFLLVANLPYSIASSLMLNLITSEPAADAMFVTVQKQVADRMTAVPGSSDYGSLSIHLRASGEVKTMRVVKPTAFWPRPQVCSAMVSFVHKKEKSSRIQNTALFSETVSLFMNHRRKMLKSCTKTACGELAKIDNWPEIFEQCSIDPTQRPEQLCPQDYIAIANRCHGILKSSKIRFHHPTDT